MEWIDFGFSCEPLLSSKDEVLIIYYNYWSVTFRFQIYQKLRSSLAYTFRPLYEGLQLAGVKIKSCVLLLCEQTTLKLLPTQGAWDLIIII